MVHNFTEVFDNGWTISGHYHTETSLNGLNSLHMEGTNNIVGWTLSDMENEEEVWMLPLTVLDENK